MNSEETRAWLNSLTDNPHLPVILVLAGVVRDLQARVAALEAAANPEPEKAKKAK